MKLNPNGQVPVLDDDGFILYESLAINLYLAKKQGGPLGPASLQEEALFMQWSFWAINEGERLLITILEHRMVLPEGSTIPPSPMRPGRSCRSRSASWSRR